MSLPAPYYDHGGITIYNADCREILPHLGRFDLLLTDPPYGTGLYETDNAPAIRLIMDAAPAAAIWGYPELLVRWCIDVGRPPNEWITWWPSNAGCKGRIRTNHVPRETEAVALFADSIHSENVREPRATSVNREGRTPDVREGDVWRDASPGIGFNARQRMHPNEKPVSVMGKLLDLCLASGGSVVDPYMGSGPVAKACKDRGLRYVGIELVEKYCAIAVNRLRQEVLFGGAQP